VDRSAGVRARVLRRAPPPTPATIRSTGPSLGAHNRDVYGALGLDEAELEALTRDGVI